LLARMFLVKNVKLYCTVYDHFIVISLLEMIIPNLSAILIVTTLLLNVISPFPTTFEIYICPSTLVTVE